VPEGRPPLGPYFRSVCPFPPVRQPGGSAGVSSRQGPGRSVLRSRAPVRIQPSCGTVIDHYYLQTRDLPNGFLVIPDPRIYCAKAPITRWYDRDYRFLDPTNNRQP
jgi:hypothetical protein